MAYNRFLGQNGFRGVDFTSHPSLVHPDRLADALNVWKDYRSGQGSAIETFPGFRQIFNDPIEEGEIYGIFRFLVNGVNYLIIHKDVKEEFAKAFAKEVKKYVPSVVLSVVKDFLTADEIEECHKIADFCGVTLKVRDYIS